MAEEREMLYVMPAKLANPAPLGLGGFALTTFVLNVHNAGLVDIGAALPLGLFYGGLAQLIAGFLEFRTGNTFGMTAFGSFGAFWIALSSMVLMQMNKWLSPEVTKGWLLVTLVAWTIFTFVLWIATFRHSRALVWVFTTLLILFGLLDAHVWTGSARIGHIAGWEGIFCAFTAWYLMAAIILNDTFGRTVLPIGSLEKKPISEPKARWRGLLKEGCPPGRAKQESRFNLLSCAHLLGRRTALQITK